MELIELAKRVRRGVALLNRHIPNWRTILRKHIDDYDFSDGDHCVLGTLEHYSGRMRVLKRKKKDQLPNYAFGNAEVALGIEGLTYGFDATTFDNDYDGDIDQLDALWRAEFEKE
jgi:hypothetical protein